MILRDLHIHTTYCDGKNTPEEMVVEASLTGNKEMIYQAICYDPLTAAVCSLREIRDMVDEMFAINKDWLPQFEK